MKTFALIIASPDGNIFEGQATQISLRGIEGDLAVMAGHVPFITAVKPCECHVYLEDDSLKTGETDGGLLTVSSEKVSLLSGSFRWKE